MSAVLVPLSGLANNISGNLITIIPSGNIGGIEVFATLEETMTDTVRVTEHPVEAGAEISDHAYYRPAELVMRCGWSNSIDSDQQNSFPASFAGGKMSISDYVSDVYSQLLSLQQSLQPLTVINSIRQYANILITSLAVTRNQRTSQALMCTVTMRQIIIVNTQTATIPPANQISDPSATPPNQVQLGSQALQTNVTPSPGGNPGSARWPPGSDEASGNITPNTFAP